MPAPLSPTCIELSSGEYLDLACPDPALITVEVVAHHLAQVNRFTGAAKRPLSVAEHACLVVDRLAHQGATLATQLVGLHHDDPEAFAGDVTRPLKLLLRDSDYNEIEHALWLACVEAFNLPTYAADKAAIKAADDWALSAEAYHLMPSKGAGWVCDGLYDPAVDSYHAALQQLGLGSVTAQHVWRRYEKRLRLALAALVTRHG